jgi:hypothetical protein
VQAGRVAPTRKKHCAGSEPVARAAVKRDRCAAPLQHRLRELDAGDDHNAARRKDDAPAPTLEAKGLGRQVAARRILGEERVNQSIGWPNPP